jgi:ferredoxin, 2Fe-2S
MFCQDDYSFCMPSIQIPQKNKIISVELGKNLMDALLEAGLPVASSCQGQGICSKCFVTVSPIGAHTELELKTLEKNKLDFSKRLCCQIFTTEDLTVETTY